MSRFLRPLLPLCLTLGCGPAPTPADQPDVVLVILDALRADRTSVLGPAAITPRLASLAQGGRVYTQAVSPSSWTLPSMAALFSGAEVTASLHAALVDRPALAEHFADAGYFTVGLVANPLLTADNGFQKGFSRYAVAPAESTADLEANLADLRAWDAEALVARALAGLDSAPREVPVFLYLHLMDPHVPYDPAHERLVPWQPSWSGAGPDGPPPPVGWTATLTPEQSALLGPWRRAYDGQVAAADRAVGRLLEHLPKLRSRPWIAAITADHGEGLFSHRLAPDSPRRPGALGEAYGDHGEQLYEEAIRVPLWLIGSGIQPGVEDRPVALRDLGATLLAVAGIATSMSRLPLSEAEPVPEVILGTGTRGWFARTNQHKLLVPFPERRDRPSILVAVEGSRFAPETLDLGAGSPPGRRLAATLQRWLAEHGGGERHQPDPETMRRLKALGYVR